MASVNQFDLLGDDDGEDLALLLSKKAALSPVVNVEVAAPVTTTTKGKMGTQQQPKQGGGGHLPSKPVPPTQAVRDVKTEGRGGRTGGTRGGGRGGGRGRGNEAGGGGFNRDRANNDNSYGGSYNRDSRYNRDRVYDNENGNTNNGVSRGYGATEDGEVENNSERRRYTGSRAPYRANHRGGYANGEVAEGGRQRRPYERHSGTGRGTEIKREGSGKGNWGSAGDETVPETEEVVNENEKTAEEKPVEDDTEADKDKPAEAEEKEQEPEDKEMTLEEYQKVYEEKRKALLALKAEERKVDVDKELQTMQQLLSKKTKNDDIFIKLGSEKDKRKDIAEKDEKAKKSISINEFLKPAEGEKYYNPGGRGRGRGRGPRGGSSSGGHVNVKAPAIGDDTLFPTLGGSK